MADHRLVVFTRPVDGRDAEFNEWYDDVHIPEVLEVAGFVACQRFAQHDDDEATPGSYLALYEIDDPDPGAAFARLRAAAGEMTMSDALDRRSAQAWIYSALGDRVTA